MIAPLLSAGIEEQKDGAGQRINGCEVGTFVVVASGAGESKIAADGPPAMLERDYVIHLVRFGSVILMQQAIFATIPGALNHQPAKAFWNTGS